MEDSSVATATPPANYSPHALLSFGGTLSTGTPPNEIWNCNIRLSSCLIDGTLTGPISDLSGTLAVIAPALKTWWTTLIGTGAAAVGTLQQATLDYVKLNNIGSAGKYTNATTVQQAYSPKPNGALGGLMPWLVTAAYSWSTNVGRGPGSHGRVYVPIAVANNNGTPIIPSAQLASMVTHAQNLLKAVAVGPSDSTHACRPVIASRQHNSLTAITGVRVGNVMDLQRRRKDAIPETYSTATYSWGT